MRDCVERYGGVEYIDAAINSDDTIKNLDESFWLLSRMLDAGARYAKMEGIDNPKPLDVEELYDVFDLDSIMELQRNITHTIMNGNIREIETEQEKGKNAMSTQQND